GARRRHSGFTPSRKLTSAFQTKLPSLSVPHFHREAAFNVRHSSGRCISHAPVYTGFPRPIRPFRRHAMKSDFQEPLRNLLNDGYPIAGGALLLAYLFVSIVF